MKMFTDNQGVIKFTKNLEWDRKMKQIFIKYNEIPKLIEAEDVWFK